MHQSEVFDTPSNDNTGKLKTIATTCVYLKIITQYIYMKHLPLTYMNIKNHSQHYLVIRFCIRF